MKLGKRPLQRPRKIWNIDNTANQARKITHYITLDIQTRGIRKTIQFLVTNIGNEDIILGYPWMAAFEPKFSWKHATIDKKILPVVLQSVNPYQTIPESVIRHMDSEKEDIICTLESQCTVRTTATELVIQAQQYTSKTVVPKEYQDFAKVFGEEESKRYPPKRAWDHAIEFKKDALDAINCKVYPLTQEGDKALQRFITKEIKKGYI